MSTTPIWRKTRAMEFPLVKEAAILPRPHVAVTASIRAKVTTIKVPTTAAVTTTIKVPTITITNTKRQWQKIPL